MGTVLDDLKDLHGQATAERSHYYVANTALRAIKHIEELEEALEAMAKVIARRERK